MCIRCLVNTKIRQGCSRNLIRCVQGHKGKTKLIICKSLRSISFSRNICYSVCNITAVFYIFLAIFKQQFFYIFLTRELCIM